MRVLEIGSGGYNAALLAELVDEDGEVTTGETDEQIARWCGWLRQVWACEEFAAALEVASPALARRVRQV